MNASLVFLLPHKTLLLHSTITHLCLFSRNKTHLLTFSFFQIRSFRVAAKSVSGSFFKTKFTNLVCTAHITSSTHFSKHTFALFLSSPRVTLYSFNLFTHTGNTRHGNATEMLREFWSSLHSWPKNTLPNTPKNVQYDPPFTTVHELVLFTTWDGPLPKASRMILDLQVRRRSDSAVSTLGKLKHVCDVTSKLCSNNDQCNLSPLYLPWNFYQSFTGRILS